MERTNVTECILKELGKFDPRCKRRDELENKDALTNHPMISDVVEYFVNLDYMNLLTCEIDDESIYKTYVRDNEGNVVISFIGTSLFEEKEFTFAKIVIKKNQTLLEMIRPYISTTDNYDNEYNAKSQIVIYDDMVRKDIYYKDDDKNNVWDYKYAKFDQKNEPYFFAYGRYINQQHEYEAGLEKLNIDYEDRIMFEFDSVDNLKPYSKLQGNITGALIKSNAVDTVESIYVRLKSERELRIKVAQEKAAKRIRKKERKNKKVEI